MVFRTDFVIVGGEMMKIKVMLCFDVCNSSELMSAYCKHLEGFMCNYSEILFPPNNKTLFMT